MSPPIRRKYHNSVAFATGCKKIKKCRRGNRKIRIPIAMWPCRVEEKMTLKEVDGQTVEEIDQAVIQDLETKVVRLYDQGSYRPPGTLPSNTQPNLKQPFGSNDKRYRLPPARNDHVNDVFTRSGKPYDPPPNSNDKTTFIYDDNDEEEETNKDCSTPSTLKQT
ncbi:hypothetical protein Tco_1548745 [Tanacetum coccineum]